MTDFTVTITDQSQLDGIAHARGLYNAALPVDDKGAPIGVLATDRDYIAFVVTQAAASYARDQMASKVAEAVAAAIRGEPEKARRRAV